MTLVQFNLAFSGALDLAAGAAVPSLISYAGGRLYGALAHVDPSIASKAFMASTIAAHAFQTWASFATGGGRDARGFCQYQLLGVALLGSIQIYAYRKLQLISSLGTAVLAAFTICGSLEYMRKLNKPQY
jgi:hypothetical protein